MKWIQIEKLLNPPYNMTPEEIWKHVEQGRLVPYEQAESSFYPDPDEHRGAQRVFPTDQQQREYARLQFMRYERGWVKEWLSRSNAENHEKELEDAKRADDHYRKKGTDCRCLVEDPQMKRERLTKRLGELNMEIRRLESDLDPARAWRNLDLSPATEKELLDRILQTQALLDHVHRLSTVEGKEAEEQSTPSPRPNVAARWKKIADIKLAQSSLSAKEIRQISEVKELFGGQPPTEDTIRRELNKRYNIRFSGSI